MEIAARVKAKAFFALTAGQKKAKQGNAVVFVYNPHPYKVKQLIQCEGFAHTGIYPKPGTFVNVKLYKDGESVPTQVERENANIMGEWMKRLSFIAELEPCSMNRFDGVLDIIKEKPQPKLKAKNQKIVFKTKQLNVAINTRTGLIDKYQVGGIDYLKDESFKPLVIDDNEDAWGSDVTRFNKVAGKFKLVTAARAAEIAGVHVSRLAPVRVIEDGDARSIIEAIFEYKESFICMRYKLPKHGTEIEIDVRVHWREKSKMLKLAIPVKGREISYKGQVAYGVGNLPDDGTEAVAQKWVAAVSEKSNRAVTCINDGSYGSDFIDDTIRLSLVRSPLYSGGSRYKDCGWAQDRYRQRIDQGMRRFHFWLNAGPVNERLKTVDREALAHNEKPMNLICFPSGQGKKAKSLVELSDDAVQITAVKMAENNKDLIIRLFEPTGQNAVRFCHFHLPVKR